MLKISCGSQYFLLYPRPGKSALLEIANLVRNLVIPLSSSSLTSRTVLYYADAAVADSRVFERGEPFEFAPKGGGGTSFVPVFDAVQESGEEPLCLIYFTDLQGTFPKEAPPYPVIWLTVEDGTAPFGEVLKIDLLLEGGN